MAVIIYTQHFCAKCGSDQMRRNGHSQGHARYQCKAYRYQARFEPAAVAKAAQYAQVDQLLGARNSQRSIVRVTGVSRMSVAKRIKKAQACRPPLPRLRPKKAQKKCWEALDELWTFVGRKKRKLWRWLAVERASRRIVAWTLGGRGEAAARRLWHHLPRRYRRYCWYFTDEWKACASVLPRYRHRPCPKGEGQTSIVETINCSLRQRSGVLVRQSCSFSKCRKMHTARIKIVIDNHNRSVILN
ncbi:IS1 family transposase [Hymenobacter montanus]|uniref:IS1 family transposase n=1 Tax=Hymenobacter montanus TaxID=2771359 RepID=UPI001CC31BCA|nr:IS1 family transposase [Hymenobacter montanus]